MIEETVSDEENARLWAEEAERRDQAWDADPAEGRPAADVFRDARARLRDCFVEAVILKLNELPP